MGPTLIARCCATSLPPGVLGHEREELAVDADGGGHRDRPGPAAVFQTMSRADELRRAQRAARIPHRALHENRLRLVVHARRDEVDGRRRQLWPPSLLSTWIGRPFFRSPARSIGTDTYTSSVSF